ncbi:MAG: CDP-alcohol phosphatidyltransferase family protein [Candidatus Eisenbacteria bacterium]|nr:CDP-alcohol phosphatidyltransferase family protein [Candidatus Eisenbacteria bacterium]
MTPTAIERIAFLSFLTMIAVAVVSMGAYAWLGRKRDADVAGKGGQFLGGAGDFPLHWFMWAITPAVTISRALGLTPDFYNYVGLAFGIAGGWLVAIGRLELAGWAIVLGGVADVLDGRIARLTQTASNFGDFIDSTFDRFVEAATFLGFAWYLRDTRWGPLLSGAALSGSLIVSYARARGEVHGVNCTGGLMQRAERMALTALVCFLGPPISSALGLAHGTLIEWVLGLIAAGTWYTAIYRTAWIAARLR